MFEKNKKEFSPIESLKDVADIALHPHFHLSVAFMGAASLLSVMPHVDKRVSSVSLGYSNLQPAVESIHDQGRAERDEVHPQHRSYGISQRTPGRSGTL